MATAPKAKPPKNPVLASFDMSDEDRQKKGSTPEYTDEENGYIEFLDNRIKNELFVSRKSVGKTGTNVEEIWNRADRSYEPKRISQARKKRVLAEDPDNKGVRGVSRFIELGADNWQSDRSQPNIYSKIQTALSILIDSNPEAVFRATQNKYKNTTNIVKDLYRGTWDDTRVNSKGKLKVGIFNGAKYGFFIGRTYAAHRARTVRDLVSVDEKTKKPTYEFREHIEYSGVMRESLNPRHTWLDDMTIPEDPLSTRDWAYYKKYSYDAFIAEFPVEAYPYAAYVSNTSPTAVTANTDGGEESAQTLMDKKTVDVFFYENKELDWYAVKANGVWVSPYEPLPPDHKDLSCWWSYWTLRDDTTPYGIGIFEAIEQDQELKDLIWNMTIDQLVLSIYKFWLYSGNNTEDGTGKILVKPGTGHQIQDTNALKLFENAGPGQEPLNIMDRVDLRMEEASGITKPLSGGTVGKTAFESQQAREAGLQKLRIPLEGIANALAKDAFLTVKLNEQILSIPEVIRLEDPKMIQRYLEEIKGDKELYAQYKGVDGKTIFEARVPKEVALNLEVDHDGKVIASKEQQFFRIKPSGLQWEGMITIKPQSIVRASKELDKQMKLELFNLLMPLFQGFLAAQGAGAPEVYVKTLYKPIRQILDQYDDDYEDWIPDEWLQIINQKPQQPDSTALQDTPGQPGQPTAPNGDPNAPQDPANSLFVPDPTHPSNNKSVFMPNDTANNVLAGLGGQGQAPGSLVGRGVDQQAGRSRIQRLASKLSGGLM